MTDNDNAFTGWTLQFTGDADDPRTNTIVVTRHDQPQIRLEIHAPEIVSEGAIRNDLVRQSIQDAVTALQEALDSPSELPGLRH